MDIIFRELNDPDDKFNIEELGFTGVEYVRHIESQFPEDSNVNWETHGKVWIIKFNKPIRAIDITREEKINRAHYYNAYVFIFKKKLVITKKED